jgi:hypothetical protein
MKFIDLQRRMKGRPYFRSSDLSRQRTPPAHEKVQLSHWVKEGKLIRLKRGVYSLSAEDSRLLPSALELAEPLYRPSYISLEFALSHYGLLPEAAGLLTSVTTRKTARLHNSLGDFVYHHVQPDYFFGFHRRKDPVVHWMADPEKALLDFLYLSIPKKARLTEDLLVNNYRLQNVDLLNAKRLREMLSRFTQTRVRDGGRLVLSLMARARRVS